ncbi:baseplate J/gp47 family protein [Robbsia andropogonis]|uniref:baseplate J/gp47 family protein n=1 Tax=Robbsia andropogonis TaxID=28092 RepID=UPI00209DB1C9|nr:baseplate J/gp47 family protein [Robbsia andropogonis]MCP1120120.1 baseplate J/gp47 family protein [Robbsia andropogonis]MCP1130048.1 baseplate J/gp47 family protein [Robbsia andropogonis]
MATTYPLATLACTIDATGISAPSYSDIYQSLVASYQSIFGSDVVLTSDSQDGQFIGVIASAINDANSATIDAYNSRSPSTAQGVALSSAVKINGISRNIFTYSTVDLTIVGQVGAQITNGIATDIAGYKWALPTLVTIPTSGEIVVTATCTTAGAISAAEGTVTKIGTPTYGWQTVTNVSAAATGEPVETDATLRVRQSTSTALPSLTVLDGIIGAVAGVSGVTRYASYENDTSAVDANNIPAHAVSMVVEGGDATAIATAIASKKTPGGVTYGTTSVVVDDAYGIPRTINFFRPTDQSISASIVLKALTGYTSATGVLVQTAVAAYINAVAIGGGLAGAVEWDSCIAAAKGVSGGSTFKIVSLTLSGPNGTGTPDVALAFNQAATCNQSSVVLSVS